jgi:hypothetical protein
MTNTFFWIVLALQPGEFPSIQINNFMSSCGMSVRTELMKSGWPQYPATLQAVQQCSCVLDKIRTDHSHHEYVYLKPAEQKKLSLKYAYECVGLEKKQENTEPI